VQPDGKAARQQHRAQAALQQEATKARRRRDYGGTLGDREQRAFPDPPQPPEASAVTAGEVTANFQKQLQQSPTVIPPPGLPETPGKNPFGLEN